MLKQRLLTALILVPLVVAAVLLLPSLYLAMLLGLALALGANEWGRLSGLGFCLHRSLYILLVTVALLAVSLLFDQRGWVMPLLSLVVFWWLFNILRLWRYPGGVSLEGFSPLQAAEGLLVLVPTWFSLVYLHYTAERGPGLMLFLLVLIWGADSGAYFAGRRWGRVKLAPRVSPGKSREGVYGALVSALLLGLWLGWWLEAPLADYPGLLLLCLLTTIFSVAGDLFESLMKRQRSMKDSGTLLPGHGGMMDRIDSLTAAAPVFVLGLIVMGRV